MKRLFIIALIPMLLAGCQKQDEVAQVPTTEPEKTYVLANLALALPASPAGTRMTDDIVQVNGNFRGIQRLNIIPFLTRGKIGMHDSPSYFMGISYETIPAMEAKENFRYYDKVYLSHGISSFLTYGRSTTSTDNSTKAYNGSMLIKISGQKVDLLPDRVAVTPADLSFELEPIYNETTLPEDAMTIARYLTHIANATGWKGATNEWLRILYQNFISWNPSVDKTYPIAGSTANVRAHVAQLLATVKAALVEQRFTPGSPEEGILQTIKSTIETEPDIPDNYPGSLGLPDGAAVLLWDWAADDNNGAFVPQAEVTIDANINEIDRYAYPAELYYYGNSEIHTSNEDVDSTDYKNKNSWADVLAQYTDGTVVTANTKSVAITEPMQYAVARLDGKVRAKTATLPTAANSVSVTVGDDTFPITGILVSGQYPQNFDFTPKYDDESIDKELFIYDNDLRAGGAVPCLTTAGMTNPFRTLVLQSHDYEKVTIILELQNNGEDFEGENGTVYHGTKFYLVGKVDVEDAVDHEGTQDYKRRLFTKDYITQLGMLVETLEHAYNVMPNIQVGRLQIGVKIDMDWIQATPQTIEFKE